MTNSNKDSMRTKSFKRNSDLEDLLCMLNGFLANSEKTALEHYSTNKDGFAIVFIMGPHRSGTTLFMQWLAHCGIVAYPTNLLSRFYAAPVIGAHIQLLLSDQRYNFRDEIVELNTPILFNSENGKTNGALAPNEFWYFWRRFLPFKELDWLPDEELFRLVDSKMLVDELTTLTRVFDKPFALKSMILNYNIPFLDAIFEKALFVQIKRDPVTNVASIIDARKRQLGSEREWYSFKIPEYPQLKDLYPVTQTAGQLHYINKAVTQGMGKVKISRKLVVQYEDFCRNPRKVFKQLIEKLEISESDISYCGPEKFKLTRNDDLPNRAMIKKAIAGFCGQ